jgi:mycothiol system anti-sigma-R factor
VSEQQRALLRCAGVQRFVDAYLDGEFADSDRAELEAHLGTCDSCRHKVSMQREWKAAIKAAAPREEAPAALRNKVQRAIDREARPLPPLRKWAVRVMPIAAAAGLLISMGISRVNWSPMAADVIAKHQRNLPIEISGGADQLKKWYSDKVDFPVRPLMLPGSHLRGGRLANIRDRQAAYLVYDVNGNKVSVFIFDPRDLSFESRRKMVVSNHEVFLDEDRGYNVALFRDRGVGYAIASDMDHDQMMKLVGSAVQP